MNPFFHVQLPNSRLKNMFLDLEDLEKKGFKNQHMAFVCAEPTYVCDNSCLILARSPIHDPLIRLGPARADGLHEPGVLIETCRGTGCIHNSGLCQL